MEDRIITKGSEHGEQETEKTVLRPFSVGSLPSIYYIPDFVSPAEQNHLLHQVGVELFNPVFFSSMVIYLQVSGIEFQTSRV
jgi:hypothetical protein